MPCIRHTRRTDNNNNNNNIRESRVESHVKECALHQQDISRAHVLNNFVILNFPFIREIQTYSPHFIHHHNINVMSARCECVWLFGKSSDCLRMHARTDQILLANVLAVASEFLYSSIPSMLRSSSVSRMKRVKYEMR